VALPIFQIDTINWHYNLCKLGKPQARKRRNIRHRKTLTCQVGLGGQNVIKISHAGNGTVFLVIAPLSALVGFDLRDEPWRCVVEVAANGIQETCFRAALHHVNNGTFPRGATRQTRFPRKMVEIFRNRCALGDGRAVIKFQNRNRIGRVFCKKFRRLVLAAGYIDRDALDLLGHFFQSTLSARERVRETLKFVNLHLRIPFII
jgi:hypothetical protein